MYFTGRQHAGENIADVLKQRAQDLSPVIQMCDALPRNVPKLPSGVEIFGGELPHGRRQFVEVVQNFPEECRHVLEVLGEVYRYDAEAREGGLTPEERLRFHQAHSGPVMKKLHRWLEGQFAGRKTEPNSGLGKAKWQVSIGGDTPAWSRTSRELFYEKDGRFMVVNYNAAQDPFSVDKERAWSIEPLPLTMRWAVMPGKATWRQTRNGFWCFQCRRRIARPQGASMYSSC